jgi:hypothetical protein
MLICVLSAGTAAEQRTKSRSFVRRSPLTQNRCCLHVFRHQEPLLMYENVKGSFTFLPNEFKKTSSPFFTTVPFFSSKQIMAICPLSSGVKISCP